jgi:hypothetical protein
MKNDTSGSSVGYCYKCAVILLGAIKQMNLTAIQTWAIVVQTAVFFGQTVVLGKTLATVKKQTAAANAQAEAAENQGNMATRGSVRQAQSTEPSVMAALALTLHLIPGHGMGGR